MPNNVEYYESAAHVLQHVAQKGKGEILIDYRNINDYEGIVLSLMLVFDTSTSKYQLDLQWMCLGLDLYGDTLQESYIYAFETIEELLSYLEKKCQILPNEIPTKYQFDPNKYPSPLAEPDKKQVYNNAWVRFQNNFNNDQFLDDNLKLIYTSKGN